MCLFIRGSTTSEWWKQDVKLIIAEEKNLIHVYILIVKICQE